MRKLILSLINIDEFRKDLYGGLQINNYFVNNC